MPPQDCEPTTIPVRRVLTLRSRTGDVHAVTTERTFEDVLLVRRLFSTEPHDELVEGDPVDLSYGSQRGLYEFSTRVLRGWENDSFLWLSAPADVRHIQRREFVRTRSQVPVRLRFEDRAPAIAWTRDLSACGALLESPIALDPGRSLELDLELPQPHDSIGNLSATAIRSGPNRRGTRSPFLVAVHFDHLDHRSLDLLVHYVFQEGVAERA